MANVISNVFKQELLKGNHDFDGGATYKIALYTSAAVLSTKLELNCPVSRWTHRKVV